MFNDIWYRSSYELNFLEWCNKNNITVQSASNSIFRVRYEFNGRHHFYYPDFYLPQSNSIVEVKAEWQLIDDQTQAKINEACIQHENFTVVDEEMLADHYDMLELFSGVKN